MQQPTKRLGEMLVEAGLITPAQLQSAITHQKIAKGRMGSNLVALGYITEDVLMDFLSHQMGVPQVDVRETDIPFEVLQRIPRRMAEQFTILPISIKEPKSLVLAMADPMDLNAIDSARFASSMNVDPVVASHSALRKVIVEQYRRLELLNPGGTTIELKGPMDLDEGLPVNFNTAGADAKLAITHSETPGKSTGSIPLPNPNYSPDPFFDAVAGSSGVPPMPADPFGLFDAPLVPPPTPASASGIVDSRTTSTGLRRIESYQTRTLVLGLIKLMQRRGIMGQDELQRLLANWVESGELRDDGGPNAAQL
jgi:Type II secretion system (T2SS), protein E, N-terminal domain